MSEIFTAEAERLKKFIDEVFLMPVEMEDNFYVAAMKFINGDDPYMPSIYDYEEAENECATE